MDNRKKRIWNKWLASRPAKVAKVARIINAFSCYKIDGGGHYRPNSYGEGTKGKVYISMVHGRDSFLPGVIVFGVRPGEVTECGCGRWRMPTKAQTAATTRMLKAEKELKESEAQFDKERRRHGRRAAVG
jgi:hypothetical protein